MSVKLALIEFANILDRYMEKFGLYSQDVSSLANSTRDIVAGLKNSKTGLSLKSIEAIANIFGLRYFEFGNPNTPIPSLKELPQETIDKINWRKKIGPPENNSYNKLSLNKKVIEALYKLDNTQKFLPSEVFKHLAAELQKDLKNATRITRLFILELADYVEKTGEVKKIEGKKGRPEEYYRLIKDINK